MSHSKQRGKADSSWAVSRRCWQIILRLQQGPATKAELIEISYQLNGDEKPEKSAADKRFQNDKKRIENSWGIKIRYDRNQKVYVMCEADRPLLNLSTTHLETLSFLRHNYQQNTPGSLQVIQLIDQLINWLPQDRQRVYHNLYSQRNLQANHSLRDAEKVHPNVESLIRQAFEERRKILFEYRARDKQDSDGLFHRVQPWELRVNKRRRHLELWGYCEWQTTSVGEWEYKNYRAYRLSRIKPESIEILSQKMPPVRPIGKPIRVVYELHPSLLVGGLSSQDELIDEPTLTELPNGWWRVEGRTYSVFSLARELLYYGEKCRVVEGEGREDVLLLDEMKKIVGSLHEAYFPPN